MKIIYEGKLKHGVIPYKVSRLASSDIEQILLLQNLVVASLEDKESLQPLTLQEFEYILDGKGLMVGAFVNEQLIAFRALLIPVIDSEHLGYDIRLAEEELSSVVYQEISIVHPQYRGNHLQQILAKIIMNELSKLNGKYSYICCTVAPFNIPSLKDKFSQGMEIASLKEKYGGRLRYVFVKKLVDENKAWTKKVTLNMNDTASQQKLLSQGWRGIRMEKRDNGIWVEFGKQLDK
ncbi:GNAT family N-acetyltransferase [Heyndrickxia sporothermodurans]|uniref:GNAT family N-acetyltransferase n=1 Tax=Heyndrickxia sporothermodurans TaxID=46224 RepID=A0AB37HK96_9BACI|nr:N-acetyltransferase [Heyndrickxia sporothermodurans]MBL5770927.1 GNAT family N-acetyltransferase [Heyndrickxia sporothermodurans]MBL5778967.1 GNAT family N-acetyltransferase [Heyndrickxia sporothermodurans]MBL5781975.1 GNAT family N-acetyltransferase [Heyndrickxia sporothermodurans]MBL5788790.1 GNAT family N-acetyltransferase [Heyndrickxia sporothermodurans]MBL5795998.1 GNAT family N-acetyltransferase [Heyndrickxia sporothermodurans]